MSNADFAVGTRSDPLGDSKAGVSPDLDALAAYVKSLTTEAVSPHRVHGALSVSATRGKVIFDSTETGCTSCHAGPRLSDSGFLAPGTPMLRDVGTLRAGSGKRRNEALTGLDTPTLHGLWNSGPYLHDGSAGSLRDVLSVRNPADKHGRTTQLSSVELDDLVAYLLSLDGRRE